MISFPAQSQEEATTGGSEEKEVTYSDIRKLIDDGVVEWGRVSGDGWWVNIKTIDGSRYYAQITPQTPIADHLYEAGIPVRIQHRQEDEDELPLWLELLINLLPLLIFLIFFAFVMLIMGKTNKKHTDKYDDYLAKVDDQNQQHFERVEKLQKEFFEQLRLILTRQKDTNG